MSTQFDISTEENRAFDFADEFGIYSHQLSNGTKINPSDALTMEMFRDVGSPEHGVTGIANVVALFFDLEKWDVDIPNGLMENTEHSVIDMEKAEDGDAVVLKSEASSKTRMTTRYMDKIQDFLGISHDGEFLEQISMNTADGFPIKIDDTETKGTILLAPRKPPEDQP